jgi:MoaA/NifB/PqqE/SkfB family radical SAM enzyme
MCGLKNRDGPEPDAAPMDTGTVKRLLGELREMGAASCSISGGEPLLRPDLFEIIRACKALGFPASLSTNGLLVTPETAAALVSSGIDQITVSLDTTDEERYASFRGVAGGARKAMAGVERLAEAKRRCRSGARIAVSCSLVSDGLDDLESIISFGERAGADALMLMPVTRFEGGRAVSRSERPFDEQRFFRILGSARKRGLIRIDNSPAYLRLFADAFEGRQFPLPCLCGYFSLHVGPFGELFPCPVHANLGRPDGTYRPGTLARFWNSPDFRARRLALMSCRDCHWNCMAENSIFFR